MSSKTTWHRIIIYNYLTGCFEYEKEGNELQQKDHGLRLAWWWVANDLVFSWLPFIRCYPRARHSIANSAPINYLRVHSPISMEEQHHQVYCYRLMSDVERIITSSASLRSDLHYFIAHDSSSFSMSFLGWPFNYLDQVTWTSHKVTHPLAGATSFFLLLSCFSSVPYKHLCSYASQHALVAVVVFVSDSTGYSIAIIWFHSHLVTQSTRSCSVRCPAVC